MQTQALAVVIAPAQALGRFGEEMPGEIRSTFVAAQVRLEHMLHALGGRESGTARLEEAVMAYRAALEEITRAQVPLQWARTQMNLGATLFRWGEREIGTARLKEAVTAYRAALEEMTREWVPLDWAKSTGNQGIALILLAERLGDVTKARLGIQQIEVAFAIMRDGGNAPAAAYYEAQLLKARSLLDLLTSRSKRGFRAAG
jgi:exonuclease VII small subunit